MLDLELFQQMYKNNYEEKFLEITKDKENKSLKDKAKKIAQGYSIKETFKWGLVNFISEDSVVNIWEMVHKAYLEYRLKDFDFNNLDKLLLIQECVSAEQSWKSSSGNTFETCIKDFVNPYLEEYNIQFVLQKDLNELITNNLILNNDLDLNYLKERVKSATFDLYSIVKVEDKYFVFGCIQAKTSIRDRVGRDREFSIKAMENKFWSIAINLNGEFLKNPKYNHMVNGGSDEYLVNGWHALYTMSEAVVNNRIKYINSTFDTVVADAVIAADTFLNNRDILNTFWGI